MDSEQEKNIDKDICNDLLTKAGEESLRSVDNSGCWCEF